MTSNGEQRCLRTHAVPLCPRCGEPGPLFYRDLPDRLFEVPGRWNVRRCQQAQCGILWLDPAPLTEDLPQAYARYFTHEPPRARPATPLQRLKCAVRRGYLSSTYGAGHAGRLLRVLGHLSHLHPGYRAQLDHEAMHLPLVPRGRLLDVGCGSGELLGLASELGWQASGVDLDGAAVAVARRAGFDVFEGSLDSAELAAGAFDAITVFHVIEHVPDPRALLSECRRLLRPGGCLVVATPNPAGLGHRRFAAAWIGLDPPRHLQLFPRATLQRDVERAGLRVLRATSSVHGTEFVYSAGRSIEAHGNHDLYAPSSPFARAQACAFSYASWLAHVLRGDECDETVLIAERAS